MNISTERRIHRDIYAMLKECGAESIRLSGTSVKGGTLNADIDGEAYTIHFTLRKGKFVSTDIVSKAADMVGD